MKSTKKLKQTKNWVGSIDRFSQRTSRILWATSFGLALFIQGCAPGKQSSNFDPQAQAPNLPEAHGPMDFTPAQRPPQPAAPIEVPFPTSAESESAPKEPPKEPAEIATRETVRQPLCKTSHDFGIEQSSDLRCPRCMEGKFTQPQPDRPKLDILFVADSSPSLETERAGIAAGVKQFVEALPPQTDYRFAVIAGHADRSYDPKNKPSTGMAGKLIVVGQEPAVLKAEGTANWSKISDQLTKKLVKMRSESATDGGEAGLYSLDKAISLPLLSENKKQGFFRSDAALAIIFISDENDLCSYGVNYPPGVVPKPNVNKYLDTGLTVEEKANQFYCRDADGNPTITSRSVFNKLRELKRVMNGKPDEAMPLLISGILYTTEASVPTKPAPNEKYPEYFFENEVGYGYLDIIRDNQGVAVDISKGDFRAGLKQIGEAAALKLEVKTEFKLQDGSSVDPNSVCVLVDGTEVREVSNFETRVDGMSYLFRPDLRELHLRGIGPTSRNGAPSRVNVFYCEPPSVIEFNPEQYSRTDLPTKGEHYRNLPVPAACRALKSRITSGQYDAE